MKEGTKNIRLTVSYDGTHYHGFQTQPNKRAIQDVLEQAIRAVSGAPVRLVASGRTDSGVHARAQVVNFWTQSAIPPQRWPYALNAHLPKDIVVTEGEEVPLHFHARKDVLQKTYRYTINNRPFPDVFLQKYQYHYPRRLDLDKMKEASRFLLGTHDFTSFCSVKSERSSHVRTIYRIDWECEKGIIHLDVTGNGFLYHMVRIIVGTLIEVGEGKMEPHDIPRILAAKDRNAAGPTAPAHGLTLWEVRYPENHSQNHSESST